jgi:hypothetical protein
LIPGDFKKKKKRGPLAGASPLAGLQCGYGYLTIFIDSAKVLDAVNHEDLGSAVID